MPFMVPLAMLLLLKIVCSEPGFNWSTLPLASVNTCPLAAVTVVLVVVTTLLGLGAAKATVVIELTAELTAAVAVATVTVLVAIGRIVAVVEVADEDEVAAVESITWLAGDAFI